MERKTGKCSGQATEDAFKGAEYPSSKCESGTVGIKKEPTNKPIRLRQVIYLTFKVTGPKKEKRRRVTY